MPNLLLTQYLSRYKNYLTRIVTGKHIIYQVALKALHGKIDECEPLITEDMPEAIVEQLDDMLSEHYRNMELLHDTEHQYYEKTFFNASTDAEFYA